MNAEWVNKATGWLGKATWFFRPASLSMKKTEVSVHEDVVTIHYTATVSRGFRLWFTRHGLLEFPVPSGVNVGTEVEIRCEDQEAGYHGARFSGILANIGKAVRDSGQVWEDGQTVHVEVKAHCESSDLLAFYPTQDGDRRQVGDEITTTFTIRKKPQLRDVIIRRYRWRRSLSGLLPLSKVTVVKNRQPVRDVQVDLSHTVTAIVEADMAEVDPTQMPTGVGKAPDAGSCDVHTVEIPLSFQDPEDEYQVAFYTKKR